YPLDESIQVLANVRTDLGDRQIGLSQYHQQAVRLNGRGDMDGFEVAIREIRAFGRALSIHGVALGTGPVRGLLDELRWVALRCGQLKRRRSLDGTDHA